MAPSISRPTSPQIIAILIGLRQLYGANFNLISADNRWINFWVMNQTDLEAMRKLEAHKDVLNPIEGHYQVLCKLHPKPGERGVFIHDVPAASRKEHALGFWYY